MKKILLLISVCFLSLSANAQKATWKEFAHAKFEDKYIEEFDALAALIVYDDKLKELDGKEISITGYYIPVEENIVIISRYNNASCFFCGNAGMESVMEVRPKNKKPVSFNTDTLLTYKGILKVNHTDWQKVSLILEDAVFIKAE